MIRHIWNILHILYDFQTHIILQQTYAKNISTIKKQSLSLETTLTLHTVRYEYRSCTCLLILDVYSNIYMLQYWYWKALHNKFLHSHSIKIDEQYFNEIVFFSSFLFSWDWYECFCQVCSISDQNNIQLYPPCNKDPLSFLNIN